jgi:hypothetical protein
MPSRSIAFLPLLPLLALSCATAAEVSSPGSGAPAQAMPASWCFEEHEQGRREALTDFSVALVRPDRMEEAVRSLADRTVVPLSRDQAAAYLAAPPGDVPGRYYLARASVTTNPGAGPREIAAAAVGDARYDLFWAPVDSSLALFVSQSVRGERVNHNLAVVLRVPVAVSKVYLGCWITD